MSIIDYILIYFPIYSFWGYVLVFASALAEALPIIGSFFPGHTIIVLSGFLAQLGFFDLWLVMAMASVGAITGDLIGYLVGRRYGNILVNRFGRYFFFDEAKYQKTKELVHEHAGKTLVIGRFSPFTRAFAPFIAGSSGVKFGRFIFSAILGGLVWGISSVLVGYIFGAGFETAGKYFGRIFTAAIVAMVVIFFAYRFLDKRRHIFAKYHVYYLALNIFSLYIFSKMAEDYFGQESTYRLDLWLDRNIHSLWQPWLNKIMLIVTNVFSPEVLFALAVIWAACFYLKGKSYKAGLVFLSSAGGLALGALIKVWVSRPRPLDGLVNETGYSFPSQHALMAIIFFSCLIFIYLKQIQSRALKYLFAGGSIVLILLIGFSRLYLKVHYFSDVIGGFALGLFWFTLLILSFRIITQWLDDHPSIFKSK